MAKNWEPPARHLWPARSHRTMMFDDLGARMILYHVGAFRAGRARIEKVWYIYVGSLWVATKFVRTENLDGVVALACSVHHRDRSPVADSSFMIIQSV